MQYEGDWGFLPPGYAWPSVCWYDWSFIIKPYLGSRSADTISGGYYEYGPRVKIYECPVDNTKRVDAAQFGIRSYSINYKICPVSWDCKRYTHFRSPSTAPLMREYHTSWNRQGMADHSWFEGWWSGSSDDLIYGYPHANRTNLLYLDTHVSDHNKIIQGSFWDDLN
jgi:prepilin-type processing-associated H-X9-DG protein